LKTIIYFLRFLVFKIIPTKMTAMVKVVIYLKSNFDFLTTYDYGDLHYFSCEITLLVKITSVCHICQCDTISYKFKFSIVTVISLD